MRSYEALQKAINGKTLEHAKRLGLAGSTVNKWQEPSADWTDSGSYNPLDRVETIIETARSLGMPPEQYLAPIYYLTERFGLICINIPQKPNCNMELLRLLTESIREFGELSQSSADALQDGVVMRQESKDVEQKGNKLIRHIAQFIGAVKEAERK